jgi:hypothetical protein
MTDAQSERWLMRKPAAVEMLRSASLKEDADSWVLLSVLMCGTRGGDLRNMIATGDYANHAVFPFERLREGLYHLQRAGLITKTGPLYRATPRAARFWREARKKERRLPRAWALLDQWLGKQDQPAVIVGAGRITMPRYDRAAGEYLSCQ